MPASITVSTLNVRGLNDPLKADKLRHWICLFKLDAVSLQETFLTLENAQAFVKPLNRLYFPVIVPAQLGRGSSVKWGTILLVRRRLVPRDPATRTIAAPYQVAAISLSTVAIAAVYFPPGQGHANSLREFRNDTWPSPTIFLGDWNTVLRPSDTNNTFSHATPSVCQLAGFIREKDLYDPLIGNSPGHIEEHWTWRGLRRSCLGLPPQEARRRIDYILVSPSVRCHRSWTDHSPVRSDHRPVFSRLSIRPQRGPGHWRLSKWVLDSGRLDSIVDAALAATTHVHPSLRWIQVKRLIADKAKFLGRLLKSERIQLASHLTTLEQEGSTDSDTYNRLEAEYLQALETKRRRDENSRLWFRRLHYDRPSKAFTALVDGGDSHPAPSMEALHNDEDRPMHSAEERLDYVASKMEELSQPPSTLCPSDCDDLLRLYDRQLRSDILDFDITLEDVESVLNNTAADKAPGPDGFPYEFYSRYWDELGPLLLDYFRPGLLSGFLDPAATEFTFTFLHKSGRDPHKLGSYRPLAKQNTDYKLISGVVARRFAQALQLLIPEFQTGFLSGRFIAQQPLTLDLALTIMKARGIKGGFLFLDFVNAFNRVDHDFIEKALLRARAPPRFCTYIRALLRNKEFTVSIDGNISNRVPFRFGTAQGDPLSPFLFIFVIDFLSRSLEKDGVNPLSLDGGSLTVGQLLHADDTLLVGRLKDLELALRVSIPRFIRATGALLAPHKSYLLLHDCRLDPNAHPLLSEVPGPHNKPAGYSHRQSFHHKYLGFFVGRRGLVSNWKPLLQKVQSTLERWRKVSLTRHGRFIALRTYGFSRLYYYLYCLWPGRDDSTAEKLKNWFLFYSSPTFQSQLAYTPSIRASRLALAPPLGWGWLGIKERAAAIRVWWWVRSEQCEAPWAKLLRHAHSLRLLDTPWNQAFSRFRNGLRLDPEIPTATVRLHHVKKGLGLCPKVLTTRDLTETQKCLYGSPDRLSALLKRSQELPLPSSAKSWYKLALHHAAPGLFYSRDANKCKLCPGAPKLDGRHLLDSCSLLKGFKSFALGVFRNHRLGQSLRDHGSWWPSLPNSKVLATFIIITLHVAWKARCSFRYDNTPLDPIPYKFIRMVLDDYRRHVVVIQRRLSHRKVDKKKQFSLDDWLIPGHLFVSNGFLTISCI